MQGNEYQGFAIVTANMEQEHEQRLCNWAMGLCGEAGEYTDLIKKHVFHGHAIDREKAVKELGDIAWYLALNCFELGIELDEVLEKNVAKLRARYGDKFSKQASQQRNTEAEDRAVGQVATDVHSSAISARLLGSQDQPDPFADIEHLRLPDDHPSMMAYRSRYVDPLEGCVSDALPELDAMDRAED